MKVTCRTAELEIALGGVRSPAVEVHLETCARCRGFMALHREIAGQVEASAVPVPRRFTDDVMACVLSEATERSNDPRGVWAWIESLFQQPAVVCAGLGLGGIWALANLSRFVFFVLIPA